MQDRELRSVETKIKRNLDAITRQEARIEQLQRTYTSVLESAFRTLANTKQTVEVLRLIKNTGLRKTRRELSLRLLQQESHRGALLSKVASHVLPQLLEQHDIGYCDAMACMRLNQEWEDFVQAEQWNAETLRSLPSTAVEAIALLDVWKQIGSPNGVEITYCSNA